MPGPSDVPSTVLLAPNAFKGTLSPAEAAAAMSVGVLRVLPDADLVLAPIADGGDGSLEAFASAGFTLERVTARGPTGLSGSAPIARRGPVAVVELAATCGMARLHDGLAPMTSSTLGLGDALRAALDRDPARVVVCLGGSASTDGGAGLLAALGARLLDADGREVDPSGAALARIASLDLTGLDPRVMRVPITVAVDVTAPLVGEAGAAHVFAPQKGATPDQVRELDRGLRSWSEVLRRATGQDVSELPGAGAAGGTAAALVAACRATLVSGADLIMDTIGLPDLLGRASVVITGEGRLDHASTLGKGAVAVAARAAVSGVPVLAVCGRIAIDDTALRQAGFAAGADCSEVPEGTAADEVSAATEVALQRWLETV